MNRQDERSFGLVLAVEERSAGSFLTADISADGRTLLIHSLHAPDPDAIRDGILSRYESRLKRIYG